MKRITLILAFALAFVTGVKAQGPAGSYAFSESTEVYTAVSGTNSTATGDDGSQNAIPIGFTFNFDGVNYTDFSINTNGWIKLGATAIGTSPWTNTLSNTATHRPLIAAFWDDNNLGTGNIQYVVNGTAPNRTLEVGWNNVNIGGGGSTSAVNFASFKIRLYETTNVIEVVYGPTMDAAGTLTASVGINGASSYLSVTPGTPATASSAAANNSIAATTNVVGKKYIFTPPVACAGTPVAGTVAPTVQNICSGSTPAALVASGFSSGVTGLTFQWEESNDDGATDAWANAVGGTGATTASYTPPAFAGTTIYYRLKVTCSNSGLSADTASVMVAPPAAPSNQITALTIPAISVASTQAIANWTNGNGTRRVVFISDSATFTDPVDTNGPALTPNVVYSGSGQQLIYDGTGTTVTVRGLAANTQYYIKAYEYRRCGTGPYDYFYNVTTGTNVANFTTCSATAVLPWSENFDGLAAVGTNDMPSCWVEENGDWATANAVTYNTPNSGTNYLRNSWSANNEYIWTQGFNLTAGTSYDFSSFVQGDGATGWAVDFFVNSTQNSAGATQLGATYSVPGTGTIALQPYAQVTRTFVPSATGVYYFGVRVNQPSGAPWYVAFDDFELKLSPAVAPGCAANLAATPDPACGNFANTLTWDATPTATGYYITIGTTSGGNDIANAVDLGTNSYSFSGTVNTQYFWTVTPYNGAGSATGCAEQSFTTAATGCYCPSVPTSHDGVGITNVQIVTTDFPNGDVSYFDHSATVVDMAQGISNNVQVTFDTGYTYNTNIWIDFNDNYVFEASELVFQGESTDAEPTTLNASFIMPVTAPLGQHMMRIGTADSGQATPDPCYSGAWGVTLDFAVNIVAATCTPPAVTTAINADCGNGLYFVDVNVTDLGDGSPYISDGIDVWPIAGLGITQVGPFADGASVTLTVYHGTDATCDLPLGNFAYACPPANDECSTAIALTVNNNYLCGVVTAGTTAGATQSSQPDDVSGTPAKDVWYSFVATGTAHRISLTNIVAVVGTSTDMGIGLYDGTGTCAALAFVGTSDPETYNVTGLTAGTTYYVRVYGWYGGTDQMTFNICIGTPPPPLPPPANDDCANAITISTLPYNFAQDASGSTNNAGFISQCGGMNDGVWYTFTVDTPGDVTVTLTGIVGGWDPEIGVYSGSCGTFTCVDSADDFGNDQGETLTLPALAAGQYWINVGNYSGFTNGAEGPLTIDVTGTAVLLGNASFDSSAFKAYPNPVKDVLNLSYSSDISNVEVFNMLGQTVMAKQVNAAQGQVDMSNLSSGSYIVKVTSNGLTKSIKVIKQ